MKSKKILLSMFACSLLSVGVSMQAGELDHLEELRKRLDAQDQAEQVMPQASSQTIFSRAPYRTDFLGAQQGLVSNSDRNRLEALREQLDAEDRKDRLALQLAQAKEAKRKADQADQDEKDEEAFRKMYADANSKTRAESGLLAHHESLPYVSVHDVNMNQ